jgi:hypothetical protein
MTGRTITSAAAAILVMPVAAAVFLAGMPGCGTKGGGSPNASALPPADATYTTRGQVESLPGAPGGSVKIHHEAIPEFKSKAGTVVGMGSMTMPFMPAEGLDLAGLAPGDLVSFTWEVRWNARPNSRIVKIEKLAPGTTVNFGAAPAAAPPREPSK